MIYICGAIASLDIMTAKENFAITESLLIEQKYNPLNPFSVRPCTEMNCNGDSNAISTFDYTHSWGCYLKYDLAEMCACCDSVAQIKGWENSPGARFETYVALQCGMKVDTVENWLSR